jgi:hypothetical protein
MEQWSAQHSAFIDETFFKNGDPVKMNEYFASISILLITE